MNLVIDKKKFPKNVKETWQKAIFRHFNVPTVLRSVKFFTAKLIKENFLKSLSSEK